MDDKVLNIKALAANGNESIAELAKRAGINSDHLYNVSAGRAVMTAEDLVRLSIATGVPERNIQREYTAP